MRRHLAFCFMAVLIAASSLAAERRDLLVSTSWLEKHLQDPQVIVIDVTESDKFGEGHIPGAKFIALRDLVTTRDGLPNEIPDAAKLEEVFADAGVPDKGRIIIYAHDIVPAARAFLTLEYLGRRGDCALLDGMYAKWIEEKRPVEIGMKLTTLGSFKAHSDPGTIVKLDGMKTMVLAAQTAASKFAIVDARPADFFSAAQAGYEITRAGHIPTAINVPYAKNLTSDTAPLFRPSDELRALYRDAGVKDEATVITYCRTGMEASVDYFVLRNLGREVHLYDGSYYEWSGNKDLPVAGK
jgi:thiosulfate/3-mercaptopyruvate sulfurtransferase